MTLILNDSDVAELLDWRSCVEACEEAYTELAFDRAATFGRRDVSFPAETPDSVYRFVTMEGGVKSSGVFAQRVDVETVRRVTVKDVYKQIEVPITQNGRWVGLVYLYSMTTGELLAIMTDGEIQRMRVAGTSAVAAKYMARDDAEVLALFGAGQQAEAHAFAISAVRKLKSIRVYSPTASKRDTFCKMLSKRLGVDILSINDPVAAMKGADILAAATSARQPVCKGEWISSGQHLGSIVHSEFDAGVWQRADVAVCSNLDKGEVRAVAGADKFAPRATPSAYESFIDKIKTLTGLLRNEFPARRTSEDVTVFLKGLGLGIEFASTGRKVYDGAVEKGIGKKIPSEWFTQGLHT